LVPEYQSTGLLSPDGEPELRQALPGR